MLRWFKRRKQVKQQIDFLIELETMLQDRQKTDKLVKDIKQSGDAMASWLRILQGKEE